jgi:hypothetical protein
MSLRRYEYPATRRFKFGTRGLRDSSQQRWSEPLLALGEDSRIPHCVTEGVSFMAT